MKRKHLIGIGGIITLATIVSFNVFGNPVSSNEEKVTDEEITIHNNNYYQDGYDDYDIEILSNGGMALATFLSEKLKDTGLRLYKVELDLSNLPNRLIHIENMSDDKNTKEVEKIVNVFMQSAIEEGIIQDNEPYEIIVP